MIPNENKKLSVLKIWGEVNAFCQVNWKPLIKSLLILFLVQIAFETYLHYLEMRDRTNHIGLAGIGLISFLVSVVIAVTVHRLMLKGQTPNSIFGNLRWTFAETKYALYILAILFSLSFLAALIIIFVMKLSYLSGTGFNVMIVCLAILGVYIATRLALIFPAIAIGDRLTVASAWKLTSGNTMKLILIIALVPIIYASFLALIDMKIGPYLDPMPYQFLSSLTFDLITIYSVMCLSLAYKHLTQPIEMTDKPLNA